MWVSRFLVVTILLVALVCSSPNWVDARQWKPILSDQATEYTQIFDNRSPEEKVMIYWVAPETVNDCPAEIESILRGYLLVAVYHLRLSSLGKVTFQTPNGVQVKTASGKARQPLVQDTLPHAVIDLISSIQSPLSEALGHLGRGIRWYIFDGKGIDSCQEGVFWIVYAGEQYRYETPIPGCGQAISWPRNRKAFSSPPILHFTDEDY